MSKIKIIESDFALNEDALNRYEKEGLVLISASQDRLGNWTYHFRVPGVDPTHGTAVGPICPTCKSDDATVPGTVWRDRHNRPCEDPYHADADTKPCACWTCSAEVPADKVLCNKCDDYGCQPQPQRGCEECKHAGHEPGECQFLHIYARGPNDMPGNQRCLCGYVFEYISDQSNDGNSIHTVIRVTTVYTQDPEETA